MSTPGISKYRSDWAALGARVAKAVAWVSGVFSLVLCALIVVNQVQTMANPPLNDPVYKALRDEIQKDLKNEALRQKVEAYHLIARQAFFSSQAQLRAGGLLLLGGVVIFLASMKTYVELTEKLPMPLGMPPKEGGIAERSAGRWAVVSGAGLLVFGCLVLVYLSPPTLDFAVAAEAAKPEDAGKTPAGTAPTTTPKPPDAATAAAPTPAPAHAWPGFRGPFGQGVAVHQDAPIQWDGAKGENIKWKSEIPKTGSSSVVVWENRVFTTGASEDGKSCELYCFDAESGKIVWTGNTAGVTGSPAAPHKIPGDTTHAASTVATDGERVYAIFGTGDIVAYPMDGKARVWGRNLANLDKSANDYGHSSSLLAVPGRVLVQLDTRKGGRLLALDAKTGANVFDSKREVKNASWASPILAKVGARWEVILNSDPFVSGHDLATGTLLWKVECMKGEVAPSGAFSAGLNRLFMTTKDAGALVSIIPGENAKKDWEFTDDLPDASSPVANDQYVIVPTASGALTCLDAKTGKKVWIKEFDDEGFYSSPIIVGDRVYLMNRNGVTVVFKLGPKYEELARNPLGEKSDSTPAIPQGRIYLRTAKNLYCIGKGGS